MLDEIVETSEAFSHIMKYAKRPDIDERTKYFRTVTIFIGLLGGIVYLIHLIVGMLLGTLRVFSMPFYLVFVGRRNEVAVARRLFGTRLGKGVYSVYVPPESTLALYVRNARTPGYIIVEAEDSGKVAKLMSNLNIRWRLEGEISEEELMEFIRPKITLEPGMKVKIIAGPFAGSEAIVVKVNEAKGTVYVRLLGEEIMQAFIQEIEVPVDYVKKLRGEEQ